MGLIMFLVLGALVGVVANRLLDEDLGLAKAVGFGIAGAFLGWVIKTVLFALAGLFFSLVFSVLGAIILILLWVRVSK